MNNETLTPPTLQEILNEFSNASDKPTAELLDEYVRRFPQYAFELTECAVEIVLDAMEQEVEPEIDPLYVSPAVSRAISRYQNALHAKRNAVAEVSPANEPSYLVSINPFQNLDRQRFRKLASDLHMNLVLLCKLRDRQVLPQTLKDGFLKFVAEVLGVSPTELKRHFSEKSGPKLSPQLYKADQKPSAVAQQSFEEAVRSSELTEEQQAFLLNL